MIIFITGDNVQYILDSPRSKYRAVLQEEGTGMPPIEYVTQRGPFQHGETMVDYFLRPRVLQLLVRHKYCNENDYWNGRAELLDILRPNRAAVGIPGTIRKILSTGAKRDLNVMIEQGPNFSPHRAGWDEWAYDEALRFIAHNPIWFDPTLNTITTLTGVDQLIFPITFPIYFLSSSMTTLIINYLGNWEEYPTIRITGPISNPSIENMTTGEKISLNYTLPTGYSLIVNLTYSNKSITRNDGVNLIPYITTDSSLSTFHIAPGVPNTIVTSGSALGLTTAVSIEWYNRYIGV